MKIHSPHALRSPTQRTNFRGISPYASHPTPSKETTGPLAITEEAQCWKQLPLICKNHGCSSNTGGLGVHLQKTPHDEHYSRLKDYVSTNSEPKLSRTKHTMKKAVTRKRFRRPACSTVGQPRLIGQICQATYQSGTMCFEFNPCEYSFSKITAETHPKLAKRNHTKMIVSLTIDHLPGERYVYLGGIPKEVLRYAM